MREANGRDNYEIINKYLDYGWSPSPVKYKTKKPILTNWNNRKLNKEDIPKFFNGQKNVGILLGAASGGLVDIDLDCKTAIDLAPDYLPLTNAIFGRESKPKSHYLYHVTEPMKSKRFESDDVLFEIRSDGCQTVFPPSVHESDEIVEWFEDGKPAEVDSKDLLNACNNLEAAILEKLGKKDFLSANKEDIESEKAFNSLLEKYGMPYYLDKNNNVSSINQAFWAGCFSTENIVIYEPSERMFYRYCSETGLYTPITEDIIKTEISSKILEYSRKNNICSLEKKRSNSVLNHIVAQLKGICEKPNAFEKSSKNYIHLSNGIIDITDKVFDFVDFDSSFYSRNRSPINFDKSAECPRFLNEMLLPVINQEDIVLLQKYIGLCLLGKNLIQRLLLFDGPGGIGKSQLGILIQMLVGRENITQLRTQLLGQRFELYRFLNKTLLVGVDVPANFLSTKGASILKGLIGGDWFDAEQKGGTASFPMQGNFCVIVTSNSRLRVRLEGDVSAWKRRLLIIRFEGQPPKKKIPDFGLRLIEEEGSGILNWALQGLLALLFDIEDVGDIRLSKRQTDVIEGLLSESDSTRHFLNECIEKREGENLAVFEIAESYSHYCSSKGWTPKPDTIFYKDLDGLMLEVYQTAKSNSIKRNEKSVKGFRGVTLVDESN
ncbi:MAG: bifunctional DNA primase/polymerase [Candidatus Theseobacter exili]|nr:bifunctional DNA primase/polymerase [Candidatus Theseobacter exili]